MSPVLFADPAGDIMSDASVTTAIHWVDRRTIELSPHEASDLSRVGGKFYSGCPPGSWAVAVPFYAALKPIFNRLPESWARSTTPWSFSWPHTVSKAVYFLQIALVWFLMAPLTALFLVQMSIFLESTGSPPLFSIGIPLLCSIGSLLLCYSSVYSKQGLSNLLVWNALFWNLNAAGRSSARSFLLGALLGLAVAVDYPAFIPAALVIWFLLRDSSKTSPAHLLAGLIAALSPLIYFHHILFGDLTPYHYRAWPAIRVAYKGALVSASQFQSGPFLGLGGPSLVSLYGLSFSSFKGIFIFCPPLLLGMWGCLKSWKTSGDSLGALAILTLAATFLFVSSLQGELYWSGAPQYFGPRYLLASIPLGLMGLRRFDFGRHFGWAMAFLACAAVGINVLGAMFQDVMIQLPITAPALQKPLWLVSKAFLSVGSRIPMLDFYDIPPPVQWAVFTSYAAALTLGVTKLMKSSRSRA